MRKIDYKNISQVDKWLFEHAQIQGHICDGIKECIDGDIVNIGFRDRSTAEEIYFDLNDNEI
jgi:hypothetical protein